MLMEYRERCLGDMLVTYSQLEARENFQHFNNIIKLITFTNEIIQIPRISVGI